MDGWLVSAVKDNNSVLDVVHSAKLGSKVFEVKYDKNRNIYYHDVRLGQLVHTTGESEHTIAGDAEANEKNGNEKDSDKKEKNVKEKDVKEKDVKEKKGLGYFVGALFGMGGKH
jgi:hypothetical protein